MFLNMTSEMDGTPRNKEESILAKWYVLPRRHWLQRLWVVSSMSQPYISSKPGIIGVTQCDSYIQRYNLQFEANERVRFC